LLAVSVTVLLFYDYLLTLGDEVRYAWKMESTLAFVLFILSRYLPVAFQIWLLFTLFYSGYTTKICVRTAPLQTVYFSLVTLFAQIVMTQRTYAITRKNKWIAGILYTISAGQLGLECYIVIYGLLNPGLEVVPAVPLVAFQSCSVKGRLDFTIPQMALSFAFDVAVFVTVMVQAQIFKSGQRWIGVPSILDTVSRDAQIYFALITSTHLLIVLMFAVTRPGVRFLPVAGNGVFIPVMTCRMIMSLKKAAGAESSYSGIPMPTESSVNFRDTYTTDSIQLSTFKK